MKLKQIVSAIERIAPMRLAQGWDNVGLLVGDANRDIKNILITIDTTKEVLAEAKKLRADIILSYHPVIWSGLKRVTAEGPESVVYELIRAGISVFCIHTAFDAAIGGINDLLAEAVGIADAEPIGDYVDNPAGCFYKLIVFVPTDAVNKVAQAIYAAGAGAIGNYSHCGFTTEGTGSFLPLEGARPAIGKKGKLEKVKEIKLESVVPADKVQAVTAAMRSAHPYETPAFDIFRQYDFETRFGLGRMGKVAEPVSLGRIITKIKKATGARAMGFIGPANRVVKKAAVCAGSCGKIINLVMAADCDLYLTGELKHHQALAAQEAGMSCICLSHSVSERFALKNLAKRLKKLLPSVTISVSSKDADPFNWKRV